MWSSSTANNGLTLTDSEILRVDDSDVVRVAAFPSLLLREVSGGQLPGSVPCDLSPSPVEAPQAPTWLLAIVTNRPGLSDCHGVPGLATSHGDILVSIK